MSRSGDRDKLLAHVRQLQDGSQYRDGRLSRESRAIARDLRQIDILVQDLSNLMNSNSQLPAKALEVFEPWFKADLDPRILDIMVRSICLIKEPFDARPLIELWHRTKVDWLKWSIANTLASTKAQNCADWIPEAMRDRNCGGAQQMLCDAAAKHCSREVARNILREVFDQFPIHAAGAIGRIAILDDAKFLEEHLPRHPGRPAKYIERAIKRIRKREARAKTRRRR